MKNIKGYINIKTDIELINLRLEAVKEKEQQIKKEKESLEELKNKLTIFLSKIEEKLN